MAFLDQLLFGNPVTNWLLALGAAVAATAVLLGVIRIVRTRLKRLASRSENQMDDLVAEVLGRTKFFFILIVSIWSGSLVLDLSATLQSRLGVLLVLGLLFQSAIWGNAVIDYVLERYRSKRTEIDPGVATAMGALSYIARVGVLSVVVLTALDHLGFEVTTLLASMGIGGIALALALKDFFGDLLGALSIVLDKPFVVGDSIVVGEFQGTVEKVGLKTTRIRSVGGEQLVLANSDLLGSRIRNYGRMNERRILFTLGVTYETGYRALEEIPRMIEEIVSGQESVRFDRCHFSSFGDSALRFEVVYHMLVPDYSVHLDVRQSINLDIYRRFEERGIEFAFPTRRVLVDVSREGGGSPEP